MIKVLIIEDELEILSFLEPELIYEGYDVEVATNGRIGFEKIQNGTYDIVLLDIMLPGLSGIEVCRRVRKFSNIPIIMLTAKDQIADKVTGLDTGANDYMTKPFSIEELLARMRSVLRNDSIANSGNKETSSKLEFKDISLNPNSYQVRLGELPIELTKTEFLLLEYLITNKNRVLTREQILDAVWGYDFFGETKIVDVYISYLRNKIDTGNDTKYIQTIRGIGYILKEI